MGILRALADAVVVGAGTQRAAPRHRWTAGAIYPPLTAAFGELRARLGKPPVPLNVIVTARGDLDPRRPVFQSGEVPALVVTTAEGAAHLAPAVSGWPETTRLMVATQDGRLSARNVLDAIHAAWPARLILVEGGPTLLGDFLAERLLDELFLTLAPQVTGRDASAERPGLVAGRSFAPTDPRWADLVSVKRASSHLFLRYRFQVEA
jgi:riboflavin biosynthesis pyrimidine reductase